MWVFAGSQLSSHGYLNDMYTYSFGTSPSPNTPSPDVHPTETSEWKAVPQSGSPYTKGVAFHKAEPLASHFVITGGTEDVMDYGVVALYDPYSNVWSTLELEYDGPVLPIARYGHAGMSMGSWVMMLGGAIGMDYANDLVVFETPCQGDVDSLFRQDLLNLWNPSI